MDEHLIKHVSTPTLIIWLLSMAFILAAVLNG